MGNFGNGEVAGSNPAISTIFQALKLMSISFQPLR